MTKTKLLPLFVIVAVAAMMGTASIAPAYAAQKVTDTSSKTSGSFLAIVCGQLVDATFKTLSRFVLWDNDQFKTHSKTSFKLTDTVTGALVGTVNSVSNNQGDFVDLPVSVQRNQNVTCAGTGQISNFNSGLTIHKDGSITFHS